MVLVLRLLVDGLEEQRVLGEPLHRFDEDVHQAQPVAVALRFAPLRNEKVQVKAGLALDWPGRVQLTAR